MESLELNKFWDWLSQDEVCEGCGKPNTKEYLCPACKEWVDEATKRDNKREMAWNHK